MKTILTIFALMAVFGLAGCYEEPPSVIKPTENQIMLNSSNVTTVGNNSWIAVNKAGVVTENARLILVIIDTFEKAHPELFILNYEIESRHLSYGGFPQIFGIWVHHRPKTTTELEAPSQ